MKILKTSLIITLLQLCLINLSVPCKCITVKTNGIENGKAECETKYSLDIPRLPSIIISEEITLRELTDEDVEPLTQLILDGGIGQFFMVNAPTNYYLKQDIIDSVVLMSYYEKERVDLKYVIRNSSTQEYLGEIYASFNKMSPSSKVEIFYWVSANARGHEYAYKSSILLIDVLLRTLKINEIKFSVVKDNVASVKTIEKIINYEKLNCLKSYEFFEKDVTSTFFTENELITITTDDDEEECVMLDKICNENEALISMSMEIKLHDVWSKETGCSRKLDISDDIQYNTSTIKKQILSDKARIEGESSWIVEDYILHF